MLLFGLPVYLIPIIFFVSFFVVFIIIFVFVIKTAKTNMKIAQKQAENLEKTTQNDKHEIKDKSKICEYCGSLLDENNKCDSCGAVKKK